MPTRQQPEPPNILFVFPDQHRPDWVGFNDKVPVRTPNLDSLVDTGVAFRNAVCPAPICGPSRACLASGREYDRCGVRSHDADYPLAAPTIYGRLRNAGYHVLGTGKFDLQKHSGDQGLDGTNDLEANGFSDGINNAGKWDAYAAGKDGTPSDPYTQYLHTEGLLETHIEDFRQRRIADRAYRDGIDINATFPTPLPDRAYCDNYVGRQSIDLLRDAPDDQPWFLQVNFVGPHNPWDVTEEMHSWYRDPDVTFPDPVTPAGELSAEEHQAVRRNYAAMVENIDQWLGDFLDVVDERGESDETIFVFASDHGEMLGDHGYWYKQRPYHASTGVPFVVTGPGVAPRGVVDVPTTILDLHATFLDYAGLEPTGIDPAMDSRSMRPYIDGAVDADAPVDEGGPRDVVFSGYGSWRLAFDGRYKLIRGFDPAVAPGDEDAWDEAVIRDALNNREPLLFDHTVDRDERFNVAADHLSDVARLDAALNRLKTA